MAILDEIANLKDFNFQEENSLQNNVSRWYKAKVEKQYATDSKDKTNTDAWAEFLEITHTLLSNLNLMYTIAQERSPGWRKVGEISHRVSCDSLIGDKGLLTLITPPETKGLKELSDMLKNISTVIEKPDDCNEAVEQIQQFINSKGSESWRKKMKNLAKHVILSVILSAICALVSVPAALATTFTYNSLKDAGPIATTGMFQSLSSTLSNLIFKSAIDETWAEYQSTTESKLLKVAQEALATHKKLPSMWERPQGPSLPSTPPKTPESKR